MKNRLLKIFFCIVIVIVIVELCSFFLYQLMPDNTFGNGKAIVKLYSSDTLPPEFSISPHPYILYFNAPMFHSKGFYQYNSFGYRNEEISLEKDSLVFRILCIGASTTNSFPYVEDPSYAWPLQLWQLLNKNYPNRKFEVINAGLPFATSAEFLSGYIHRHRYFKPDLVLIEAGGNDILSAFYDHYNPELTHMRAAGIGFKARKGEKYLLKSNFFRLLYCFWLNDQESVFSGVPFPVNQLEANHTFENVMNCNFEAFNRNISLLSDLIRNDHSKVAFIPFVEVPKSLIAIKEPLLKDLVEAQNLGYVKVRTLLQEIALSKNIPVLPLRYEDFNNEDFLDLCHLNIIGETKKAQYIFSRLDSLKILEFK